MRSHPDSSQSICTVDFFVVVAVVLRVDHFVSKERESSETHNHLIFCWFGCSFLSHGASLELHECSSLQCDKFCIDFIVHRDLQQCLNWNIVIGRICSHSSSDLFYYLNIRRTGIYILCCTSAINDFSTVTESLLLDLIVLLRISGKEVIDFFLSQQKFQW